MDLSDVAKYRSSSVRQPRGYTYYLNVTNINPFDYGVYIFQVEANNETVNFTRTILKPCEPEMPLNFTLLYCTAVAAHLQWEADFPGRLNWQNFIVSIEERNPGTTKGVDLNGTMGEIIKSTIGTLKEGTNYRFFVQAINYDKRQYLSQRTAAQTCRTYLKPKITHLAIELIKEESMRSIQAKFSFKMINDYVFYNFDFLVCHHFGDAATEFSQASCSSWNISQCVKENSTSSEGWTTNETILTYEKVFPLEKSDWTLDASNYKACVVVFDRGDIVYSKSMEVVRIRTGNF